MACAVPSPDAVVPDHRVLIPSQAETLWGRPLGIASGKGGHYFDGYEVVSPALCSLEPTVRVAAALAAAPDIQEGPLSSMHITLDASSLLTWDPGTQQVGVMGLVWLVLQHDADFHRLRRRWMPAGPATNVTYRAKFGLRMSETNPWLFGELQRLVPANATLEVLRRLYTCPQAVHEELGSNMKIHAYYAGDMDGGANKESGTSASGASSFVQSHSSPKVTMCMFDVARGQIKTCRGGRPAFWDLLKNQQGKMYKYKSLNIKKILFPGAGGGGGRSAPLVEFRSHNIGDGAWVADAVTGYRARIAAAAAAAAGTGAVGSAAEPTPASIPWKALATAEAARQQFMCGSTDSICGGHKYDGYWRRKYAEVWRYNAMLWHYLRELWRLAFGRLRSAA
jgi:hypothetical protein